MLTKSWTVHHKQFSLHTHTRFYGVKKNWSDVAIWSHFERQSIPNMPYKMSDTLKRWTLQFFSFRNHKPKQTERSTNFFLHLLFNWLPRKRKNIQLIHSLPCSYFKPNTQYTLVTELPSIRMECKVSFARKNTKFFCSLRSSLSLHILRCLYVYFFF